MSVNMGMKSGGFKSSCLLYATIWVRKKGINEISFSVESSKQVNLMAYLIYIVYFLCCAAALLFIAYLSKELQSPWVIVIAVAFIPVMIVFDQYLKKANSSLNKTGTSHFGFKLYLAGAIFVLWGCYNWLGNNWSRTPILNILHLFYEITGINLLELLYC